MNIESIEFIDAKLVKFTDFEKATYTQQTLLKLLKYFMLCAGSRSQLTDKLIASFRGTGTWPQ